MIRSQLNNDYGGPLKLVTIRRPGGVQSVSDFLVNALQSK